MTWTTRPRSEFGDLSAIRAGHGPLVLLIHGVGLRAEAWNMQLEALAPRNRCVAVDMPGHGASPLPADCTQLADYTNRIAAPLEEPAVIIGHSMGAWIALDLARRFPALVQGVAALNAVFNRPSAASVAVQARASELDGVTPADPSATLARWFGTGMSPARRACQAWLCDVDPAGYQRAYRIFAQAKGPPAKALSGLSCPALFMTGNDEPNSTPEMSRQMAGHVPRGSALIIKGAAHMMPMTHPGEVNAALLEFAGRCHDARD